MKKLAIIGSPVAHSHSPAMHNFISERIGADYCYVAIEVPPEELENAVRVLKEEGAVLKKDRLTLAPWGFVVEEI